MRRLKRSFWAKAAVAVASIAIAIGVIGGISFASNNQPFLGDCIEYGIVCNYLNQTADMETNFAVGKYQGNGHWNGNTISESKANASGEVRIGEVVGETKFRGTPYVVVKESVKDEVKAMLASVSNYAESVVKKADYTTPKDVKDMNNYHVDITGIDEEVVYVDADAMVENITAGKIQNGGVKVGTDSQTCVENLFVAGEAAGGVHGENRLMGNSLLDVIVFGRNAGKKAAAKCKDVELGEMNLDHVKAYDEELKEAGVETNEVSPMLLPHYARHERKITGEVVSA